MTKRKPLGYERKKRLAGFLFTAPWLIGFIYFFIVPLINAVVYSVSEVKITQSGFQTTFVGLQYYTRAFTVDPDFTKRLVYALQNMLWQIPLIIVYSIFISLILNSKFRGRMLVRGIFFLPVIIASGIVIQIMSMDAVATSMMSGDKASTLFQGINLGELLLSMGFPSGVVDQMVIIINNIFQLVWKSGVQILLLIAGLQGVPNTVYEAAQIEGATNWEIFWKITLPIVSPIVMLTVFYTIVDASADTSNLIVIYIRDMAAGLKISYSAMMSVVWFGIIIAIAGLAYLLLHRFVYYMDDRG